MILLPNNISQTTAGIGEKARNLKSLLDLNLRVPAFAVLPSSTIDAIYKDKTEKKLKTVAQEIASVLKAPRCIVRSSALIEDTSESSFAGQFLSKGNLKPSEISGAIIKTIQHAAPIIKNDLNQLSIIVQEFIEADYAGVAFTRNPLIGRKIIIEYHKGRGDAVVQGDVSPKRAQYYHTGAIPPIKNLHGFSLIIDAFKRIEQNFCHPQDIEWCLKGKNYYFLQTRPITTISQNDYEGLLYLDQKLPAKTYFLFEKTPLTEIAERPTPFTFSLLKRLYLKNGPIDSVYNRYQVSYKPTNFLMRIGNELYIDKKKELRTLFPSYRYAQTPYKKNPRIARLRGLKMTLHNINAFQKLPFKQNPALANNLKKALEKPLEHSQLNESLKAFLQDYELIFEANLMAEKAVQMAAKFASSASLPIASLLSYIQSAHKKNAPFFDASRMIGNSLEIADSTPFQNRLSKDASDKAIAEQIKNINTKEKTELEQAGQCIRMREYCRWL